MQNGLIRVAAWLITLLLVVILAGVIGWTLRSQPTLLDLPTPRPAVAVASPPAAPIATRAGTSTPAVAPTATLSPPSTPAFTPTLTPTLTPTVAPTGTPTAAPSSTPGAPATEAATEAAPLPATSTATPAATGTVSARATVTGANAPAVTIPLTLPVPVPPPASVTTAITTVEIVGLPIPTPALSLANGEWSALTDPNEMNELVVISNTVWIAGDGGALAWTKGSSTPVLYTAGDGLYGNQLTSVANCTLPGFGVVFGSPAGLQIGDPRTGRWRQVTSSGGGMHYDDVVAVYCDAENDFLIAGYAEHGIDIYDAADEEWRHLDRNSGLAANDVNALAVVGDRDQVWVASDAGVTVSAGPDSAFYDAANSDLADDRVGALAVAPDESVWLGGDGAIYRVQGDDWTVYAAGSIEGDFPTAPIEGMAFAPDGSLWLGAADAAVCRFEIPQGRCADFYAGLPGMAPGPLTHLAVDAGGDVYYTTAGNGYSVFDGDDWRTLAMRRPLLQGNRVEALARDVAGSLWVATEAGVQRLPNADSVGELPELFPAADVGIDAEGVRALHAGAENGVWAGGVGGASLFDGSDWQMLAADDGLAGTVVQAITVDSEGRTWFGTDQGISIWNGSSFFTIDKQRGLPSDDIRALAADDEDVWIGTAGGGLYRFAGSQLQLLNRQNAGLLSDNITQLAVGPDGALWIGFDRGLARLAGGSLTPVEELGDRAITSLAVTPAGEIWAGTADAAGVGGGMFYGDGERWAQLTLADRLPSLRISALLAEESAEGNTVWIGGQEGGIMRFQDQGE